MHKNLDKEIFVLDNFLLNKFNCKQKKSAIEEVDSTRNISTNQYNLIKNNVFNDRISKLCNYHTTDERKKHTKKYNLPKINCQTVLFNNQNNKRSNKLMSKMNFKKIKNEILLMRNPQMFTKNTIENLNKNEEKHCTSRNTKRNTKRAASSNFPSVSQEKIDKQNIKQKEHNATLSRFRTKENIDQEKKCLIKESLTEGLETLSRRIKSMLESNKA